MDNQYDAIIIGAGVGGLTCGNLLAKHGMKVVMLEQHFQPGGYCTSYKRGPYLFDVPCVMGGLRKGDPIERLLSYIGAYEKVEFLEINKLTRIIGPDMEIEWHGDTYKLEYEFIDKFPDDTAAIQRFFREVRAVWSEILDAHYKPNFFQMITYPFTYPRLVKYTNYTFNQFLNKFFTNEKIKEYLGKEAVTLGLCKEEVSALLYIGYIMGYATGGIWYPKGGFQNLSNALAECFKEHGGTLRLKTRVKKIIIKNNTAIGVELDNGETLYARYVISNADTKRTYLDLIEPHQLKQSFRSKVEQFEQSVSGFVVKLAVKMDLSEMSDYAWFFCCPEYGIVKKMLTLARENTIDLDNCSFSIDTASLIDKGTEGISMINVTLIPVPYGYNNNWLSADKKEYQALKEEVAQKLILKAQQVIPGLKDKIVFMDISTPITYARYTSATQGGWYDIAMTPAQSLMNRLGPDTSIKNLYSTGAKSMPGAGLNAAIPAGLYTADMILKGALTKGRCYLTSDLLKTIKKER